MFQFMARHQSLSYLIGMVILLGGIVLGAIKFATMPDKEGYYIPHQVPGTHQIQLKEGSYRIFWESLSIINDQYVTRLNLPRDLQVRVMDGETGEPVSLVFTDELAMFDVGDRRGYLYATLEVPRTGIYLLEAGYEDGRQEPLVLSLETGNMLSDMGWALTLVVLIGLCGGGMWLAVTNWAAYRFGTAKTA